jgi:hypothetical protein
VPLLLHTSFHSNPRLWATSSYFANSFAGIGCGAGSSSVI